MLAVMTFNVFLMVAALTGFGIGYFLFGWGEYEDPTKHPLMLKRRQSQRYKFKNCREVNTSLSTTQELLPRRGEEEVEVTFSPATFTTSGAVSCSCDDKAV